MANVNFLEDVREYGSDWQEVNRGIQDMNGIKSATIEQHTGKDGELLPFAVAFVSAASGRTKFVTISKDMQDEASARLGEKLSQVEIGLFVDSNGEIHRRAFI